MLGNISRAIFLVSTSLIFAGAASAADDPTIHQIYAAAEAGQFADAQRMMDKVLLDHPNSAKAHFVEAELLAKQGRMANAAAELNRAEALEPGLQFAKPQAVQQLQHLIAGASRANSEGAQAIAKSNGFGWGPWLMMGGVIAFLVFALNLFLNRRRPAYVPVGSSGYTMPPSGPMSPAGGGLGSSIASGLASGVAVGAGVVAGEALAHHFLDRDDAHRADNLFQAPTNDSFTADDDMGGSDFGLNDNSSWDDNSFGNDGGNDW